MLPICLQCKLILVMVFVHTQSSFYMEDGDEVLLSNANGTVTLRPWIRQLEIYCLADTLEDDSFPRLNLSTLPYLSVNEVEFVACASPNSSYGEVISSLGMNVNQIDKIIIRVFKTSRILGAKHFAGLALRTLLLFPLPSVAETFKYPLNADLLKSLRNLTTLWASNVAIPVIPAASQLKIVILGVGASEGEWGGCTELRNLSLMQWEVLHEPKKPGWLAHCNQLNDIVLVRVSVHTVMRVVRGARSLRSLTVLDSTMVTLPHGLLNGLTQLRQLRLVNSGMSVLETESFASQSQLESLDLSRNAFDGWNKAGSVEALSKLNALRELSLERNPIERFCDLHKTENNQYILRDVLRSLKLEKLRLSNTGLEKLCFAKWDSLEFLNISGNLIITLEFRELPIFVPRQKPLEVILHRNPIENVTFYEEDFLMLKTHKESRKAQLPIVNVRADAVWLECDCAHAWLAQALHENLVYVNVRCPNGRKMTVAPLDQLQCDRNFGVDRFVCGSCTCRHPWGSAEVIARCDRDVHFAPRHQNLTELHAPGAQLHDLSTDDLPDTLTVLDISNNKISRLSVSVAKAMFAVRERRVWLAGNPLVCDCDNQELLTILRDNSEQVVDYANVTCVSGQPVREVALDELCISRPMRAALASTGALLLSLAAFAGALYYRFGKEIKVFLYARGWCLCCLRQDELDADRPYDAFISFAHGDFQFVAEKILPTLDQEYTVCVHYRDWVPGEMIPNQIFRSVNQSRRTIIILSRNFVKSVWGLMEFRTAHMNALRDGCVRLIIVVIDDVVGDEEIDAELRGYLRTNTYLKWDDMWFWDKIRYALPHRKKNEHDIRNRSSDHQHNLSDQQNRPQGCPMIELPHQEAENDNEEEAL